MPHVFNETKQKFEQVHSKHVPQRAAANVFKRQKNAEYVKFLLREEKEREAKKDAKSED